MQCKYELLLNSNCFQNCNRSCLSVTHITTMMSQTIKAKPELTQFPTFSLQDQVKKMFSSSTKVEKLRSSNGKCLSVYVSTLIFILVPFCTSFSTEAKKIRIINTISEYNTHVYNTREYFILCTLRDCTQAGKEHQNSVGRSGGEITTEQDFFIASALSQNL